MACTSKWAMVEVISSEEEDGSGLVQQSFRGNGFSKSHYAVCSWPVVRGSWRWELLAGKVSPE